MRFTQGIGVVLVMLLLVPSSGASVRRLEIQDLSRNATKIVVARVDSLSAAWDDAKIMTTVTITPSEVLKGSGVVAGEEMTFRIPGGTVGGISMHSGEAPVIRQGESVVLFLRPGVSDCDVYGWFQGKYTVIDGRIRELQNTTLDQFRATINQFANTKGDK